MYKRILDKIYAYSPVTVISVCIVIITLKHNLTEFINRNDLAEYIQNHRSWVNVSIYLYSAILAVSIGTVLFIILMSWLYKNHKDED
jgi:uncharacterized membrane protein YidH (DUF202 family)